MTAKDRPEIQRSDYGCGDNSCIFGSTGWMSTNGGCRCLSEMPRHAITDRLRVQRGVMALRDQIKALRADHLRAVKLAQIEALKALPVSFNKGGGGSTYLDRFILLKIAALRKELEG